MVLIGGWAHRLYRLDSRARTLDYVPLTTLDGDVAVPPKLKKEESSVRKRLLDAGFEEESVGEDQPPATRYHYGSRGGFYAEFLAPLVGSEHDRRGKRKATKEVGGVSSQLLRYIEILLISPWSIELGEENGYPLSPKRTVQIGNPACREGARRAERDLRCEEVIVARRHRRAVRYSLKRSASGNFRLGERGSVQEQCRLVEQISTVST